MRATRLWNKVRSRLGRSGEEALVAEMREHRDMIEERFRAEGLSAAEARQRAAREFGRWPRRLRTAARSGVLPGWRRCGATRAMRAGRFAATRRLPRRQCSRWERGWRCRRWLSLCSMPTCCARSP